MNFQCTAQKTNDFAGKVFTIDNYIGNKFDNREDLTFTKTHVEGSICVQYGFEKAKYSVTSNNETTSEFTCVMVSEEHGKMKWKGKFVGNEISGNYVWTKKGQDTIHYTFNGKQK